MAEADRFETAEDRTLYWTVSFYMAPGDLPAEVQAALKAGLEAMPDQANGLRSIQAAHPASLILSEAIEPLFSDISDRERLGRIDDYLFAVGDGDPFVDIEIASPPVISWATEGVQFETAPGEIGPQKARVRRFWYVHKNGAVSWHLSFRVAYQHTPAHYYFISMMQKVLAPKEFRPAGAARVSAALDVHAPPAAGTGIEPLDKVRVSEPGAADAPFWVAVARWFAHDAPALFDRLARSPAWRKEHGGVLADPFGELIEREPFLEVPGLMMPRFRFMFFFKDKEFFRRLLPPPDPATGRAVPRAAMVQEQCYVPFLDQIEARQKADRGGPERSIQLDADYWRWVATRPDYVELKAKYPEAFAERKKTIPAWEDDTRPDCLTYLFLSGFNQNIIDFMNQDASEILDSIDPIYPATESQEAEGFFVRFANARALTSYVRTSRSLETGNDYIGTCPYAFLIHVLALHNEFLARDYERSTHELIRHVKRLNGRRRLGEAAERFYAFRTGAYASHFQDRYENVFRYDTEADVFSAVEQRRGTQRKTEYLEGIVANLEKQTQDLEARIQKREDRFVTYAVAAVGGFGLFGVALQIDSMLIADNNAIGKVWESPIMIFSIIGSGIALIPLVAVVGGDVLQEIKGWFKPPPDRRERRRGKRRQGK